MAINKRKVLQSAQKNLQKGALDKALKDYQTLLEADRRDVNMRLKLGDVYLKMGKNEEAVSHYLKVADRFMDDGFDAKAVALYKQIVRLDGKRLDVYEPLAELYQRMGLTTDAMSALQTAADAYYRDGQREQALGLLRKMAALDPTQTTNRLKVADLLRQEGHTAEAVAELEEVAEELSRQNDREGRIRVFERIAEIEPQNRAAGLGLAGERLASGQASGAVDAARGVLEHHAGDLEAQELLAKALEDTGRGDEARVAWRRLAELCRERGDEDRARDLIQRYGSAASPVGATSGVPELEADAKSEFGELGSEDLGLETDEFTDPGFVSGPGGLELGRPLSESMSGASDDLAQAAAEAATPPASPPADPEQLVAEANVYLRYGKRERAIEALETVLAQVPEHRLALEKLGDALAEADEPVRAVEALSRAAGIAARTGDEEGLASLHARVAAIDPAAAEGLPAAGGARGAADDGLDGAPAEALLDDIDIEIDPGVGAENASGDPADPDDVLDLQPSDESSSALSISPDVFEDAPKPADPPAESGGSEGAEGELDLGELEELGDLDDLGSEGFDLASDDGESLDLARDSEPLDPGGDDAGALDLGGDDAGALDLGGDDAGALDLGGDDSEPPDPGGDDAEAPDLASGDPATPALAGEEAGRPDPGADDAGGFELTDEDAGIEIERSDTPTDADVGAEAGHESGGGEDLGLDLGEIDIDTDEGEGERPAAAAEDSGSEAGSGSSTTPQQLVEDLEEADFYYQQGMLEEAKAIYERVVVAAPNHPQAHLRLGEIEAALGGDAGPGSASDPTLESEPALETPEPTAEASEPGLEPTPEPAPEPEARPDPEPEPREEAQEAPEPEPMREPQAAPEPEPMRAAPPETERAAGPQAVADDESAPDPAPEPDEDTSPHVAHRLGDGDDFDLAAELSGALDPGESSPDLRRTHGSLGGGTTEEEGFEEVFAAFKAGVRRELGEGDHEAHYDLGIAYKEMGLLDDAVAEFGRAMGAPERRLACLHMMGVCALDLGRHPDALSHLEQALAFPDVPDDKQAALRFDLGRVHEARGDVPRARSAFEAVVAIDPEFGDAAERLAGLPEDDDAEQAPELADPAEVPAEAMVESLAPEEAFESFDDLIRETEEPAAEAPMAEERVVEEATPAAAAEPDEGAEPAAMVVEPAEPLDPETATPPEPEPIAVSEQASEPDPEPDPEAARPPEPEPDASQPPERDAEPGPERRGRRRKKISFV